MNKTEYTVQGRDSRGVWCDVAPVQRLDAESAKGLYDDRKKHFPDHDWRLIKVEVLKFKRSKTSAVK